MEKNQNIKYVFYEEEELKDLVLVHISGALVFNEKVREELNELYNSDKYRFYKKTKEFCASDNGCMTRSCLDNEIFRRKVMGILLCAHEDRILAIKLIGIVKRHYPEIHTIYKNRCQEDYFRIMDESLYEDYENISKIEAEYHIFILTLFILFDDGDINIKDRFYEKNMEFISLLIRSFQVRSFIKMHTSEGIQKKKKLIDSILERIDCKKGKLRSIEDMEYRLDLDKEVIEYTGIIKTLFNFDNVDIGDMASQIELSDRDIEEIIFAYTLNYNDKNIERATNILVNGIFMKTLIKSYKRAKELYFENNGEALYLEKKMLEEKINKLTEINNNMDIKIERLEKENRDIEEKTKEKYSNELNNRTKNYNEEMAKLKKEIRSLKSQLKKQSVNNEELHALREALFNINQDTNRVYKTDFNMASLLKNKKVLVIGGKNNWGMKLKNKYKKLSIIDGFNESFNTRVIENADCVFFGTGEISHAVYHKAINTIKKREIPFYYIEKTNIELVENEIVEKLKRVSNI